MVIGKPNETLRACAARLAALSEYMAFAEGRPDGDGWVTLNASASRDAITGWARRFAVPVDGLPRQRDEVGMTVAGALGSAVARVVVGPLALDRYAVDLGGASLFAHAHDEGWCDGVSVAGAAVAEFDASAHRRVAGGIASVLTPALGAVRSMAPVGQRGLWGSAIDALYSHALWVRREAGATLDQLHDIWADVDAVVDELAAIVGHAKAKPRPYLVVGASETTLMPIRSNCCLYYKIPGVAEPDGSPCYCSTCPLIADDVRHPKLVAWLDDEVAARST